MAATAWKKALGLTSRGIQEVRFAEVEIDVPVFLDEQRSRLTGPNARTSKPVSKVVWQLDSYAVEIGFRQRCKQCGTEGDRGLFSPSNEKPPYVCPTCPDGGEVVATLKSERRTLPMELIRHGINVTRVYPNRLSATGEKLIDKDHTMAQIPVLKIVSEGFATKKKGGAKHKRFVSPVDGASFDTPELLAAHLERVQEQMSVEAEQEDFVPVFNADKLKKQQDSIDSLETSKDRLAKLMQSRGGLAQATAKGEVIAVPEIAAKPLFESKAAKETPPVNESE